MTKDPRPKTTGQVRAIWAIARERGLDSEVLHELVAGVVRRSGSNSPLLGGEKRGAVEGAPLEPVSIASLTHSEAEKVIQRLKGQSFVPRRTLQYRRKKAGVKQIAQESQFQLIVQLASQRNWSADSLAQFCRWMIKRDRPATTRQANTIIEALKAMNKRDNLWAA